MFRSSWQDWGWGLVRPAPLTGADRAVFLGPISEFIGRSKVLNVSFGSFFRQSISYIRDSRLTNQCLTSRSRSGRISLFISSSGSSLDSLDRHSYQSAAASSAMSLPTQKSGRKFLHLALTLLTYRPMMIWSAAPFIGPVLGPLVSGFINQNTDWRWTYYVIIIWAFLCLLLLVAFVGETFSPELLRRKAIR